MKLEKKAFAHDFSDSPIMLSRRDRVLRIESGTARTARTSRFLRSVLLIGACGILFASQMAKADDMAYLGVFSQTGEPYGIVDLNTGAFTQLGSQTLLAGFGESGGNLYAGNGNGTYSVNPATGSITLNGAGSAVFDTFGSTTTGVYAVDLPTLGNPFLTYSVDPTTGAQTLIGSTGVDIPHGGTAGLSVGAPSLYWAWTLPTGPLQSTLYTLNLTTGAADAIGGTGAVIEAMVFVNGTMYGITASDGIDTLNLSTGLATPTGVTIAGLPADNVVYSAAPLINSTPEPSSLLLLITVIAVMSYGLRRRSRSALLSRR
jgi:hypothetical protein